MRLDPREALPEHSRSLRIPSSFLAPSLRMTAWSWFVRVSWNAEPKGLVSKTVCSESYDSKVVLDFSIASSDEIIQGASHTCLDSTVCGYSKRNEQHQSGHVLHSCRFRARPQHRGGENFQNGNTHSPWGLQRPIPLDQING